MFDTINKTNFTSGLFHRVASVAFVACFVTALAWGLCSCRTQRAVEYVTLTVTDTVRERAETVTRIDTVTVSVEVPAQSVETVTPDTASTLETDFAVSHASVSGGMLRHRLFNKPRTLTAPAFVPVTSTATAREHTGTADKPVPVPVYVEKELTAWQRFRLSAFGWLVAALSLCAFWKFRRCIYRFIYRP